MHIGGRSLSPSIKPLPHELATPAHMPTTIAEGDEEEADESDPEGTRVGAHEHSGAKSSAHGSIALGGGGDAPPGGA